MEPTINIPLTRSEAQNLIALLDGLLRTQAGGLETAKAALPIAMKTQLALNETPAPIAIPN